MVHEAIDKKSYSTRKNILQGMDVYSEKYGICGKIDIYDEEKKSLIERKKHIEIIYDGYVFQLYAQYYSLTEMGYEVNELYFYSSDTNKKYKIPLPKDDCVMNEKFEKVVEAINNYDLNKFRQTNANKCRRCV